MCFGQHNIDLKSNNSLILIDQLPNEILVIIFDNLDLKSKLRSELVCKRWHQLIDCSFKSKTTLLIEDIQTKAHKRYGDYKPFGIENCNHLSIVSLTQIGCKIAQISTYRTIISKIISKYCNLKVLYLCLMKCPLKKNLLKLVYDNCGQGLQHLSVICHDKKIIIKSKEVIELCQRLPNIKVFQLEAFHLLMKEESIALMINKWQNVQVFILNSLLSNSERKIDVQNYKGLCFKDMSPKIRVIRAPGFVSNQFALQLMADKQLKQLSDLRIFDLDHIKSITIIGDQLKSITSLYCSTFGHVDTESEANLFFSSISKLNKLQKLHLLIDSKTHIVGHNSIKHLNNCPNLTTLRIESTPLTDDCVEAISQFLPKLLKLELTYVQFKSDSRVCISPIEQLKHLECLKLSVYPQLGDNSFVRIMNSCHNLHYIDVSRSEKISAETMLACIEFANKKPKQTVKVVFAGDIRDQIEQMDKSIPKNLIVKYSCIRRIRY